jgi:hypothetical protein
MYDQNRVCFIYFTEIYKLTLYSLNITLYTVIKYHYFSDFIGH